MSPATPNGPLAGRRAVVTGASRGIGLAIARALVQNGAQVAMLARSAEALEHEAAALGPAALPVPCDVTDPLAVARAKATILATWTDHPDVLVNNAGTFDPRPIDDITPEAFEEALRVNLVAPFTLVHELLPGMRALGHGHIVTIGSTAAYVAFPENGSYSAAKFGLRGLHEVLRVELRKSGIRTTLISPGQTDTPIWDTVGLAGTGRFAPRSEMMPADAVAAAVVYALVQPPRVNVDELRLTPA